MTADVFGSAMNGRGRGLRPKRAASNRGEHTRTEQVRVEILWFEGCPNHERARSVVQSVLDARGLRIPIASVRIEDDAAARALKFPGSPTVRIDGIDVEPAFIDSGDYSLRCRLYRTGEGPRGLPEPAWIEQALANA